MLLWITIIKFQSNFLWKIFLLHIINNPKRKSRKKEAFGIYEACATPWLNLCCSGGRRRRARIDQGIYVRVCVCVCTRVCVCVVKFHSGYSAFRFDFQMHFSVFTWLVSAVAIWCASWETESNESFAELTDWLIHWAVFSEKRLRDQNHWELVEKRTKRRRSVSVALFCAQGWNVSSYPHCRLLWKPGSGVSFEMQVFVNSSSLLFKEKVGWFWRPRDIWELKNEVESRKNNATAVWSFCPVLVEIAIQFRPYFWSEKLELIWLQQTKDT